jgi:hypothetical protein
MRNIITRLKNKFIYSAESIKNRYPCKIIKVKDHLSQEKATKVTYQAVTRFNLRESRIDEILDNPMIIEKFHPTEGVKLGFLAAGEILLKGGKSIEEIKQEYEKIILKMFNDH